MFAIITLVSSLWSGVVLGNRLGHGLGASWKNILWFALSVTGFCVAQGWLVML